MSTVIYSIKTLDFFLVVPLNFSAREKVIFIIRIVLSSPHHQDLEVFQAGQSNALSLHNSSFV